MFVENLFNANFYAVLLTNIANRELSLVITFLIMFQ